MEEVEEKQDSDGNGDSASGQVTSTEGFEEWETSKKDKGVEKVIEKQVEEEEKTYRVHKKLDYDIRRVVASRKR